MKYAIIAAGEGSRMANEGVLTPKPLVCPDGEPMVDRLIRIFLANHAESISVIVNRNMPEVYAYICSLRLPVPLHIFYKNTPSSMHSFYELSHTLENGKFCLTTIDTVFQEEEFACYIQAFEQSEADGQLAVTDFIDDEKPLYVETDEQLTIHGFYDDAYPDARYISGGIYCLNQSSLPILKASVEAGTFRLRNYQRQLIKGGLLLKAWPFSKIIDVDHPEDILKAKDFLNEQKNEHEKLKS